MTFLLKQRERGTKRSKRAWTPKSQRPDLEEHSPTFIDLTCWLSANSKLLDFPIKHTTEYARACRLKILLQLPHSSVFLLFFLSFACTSTSLSPESPSEQHEHIGCSSQGTTWGTFSKFNRRKPPKAPSLRCSIKIMQAQRWGYIRDLFWKKKKEIKKYPRSYFKVMTELPRKKIKTRQSQPKIQSKSQSQSKVKVFSWWGFFYLFRLRFLLFYCLPS